MSRMFPTKNDLAPATRKKMAALLNENLASSIHLGLQAKQAHWNVKGPAFYPLHELFDQLYKEAGEWSDTMAERAVQLGGVAEGTLDAVRKKTQLTGFSLSLAEGSAHIEAVARSLSVVAKTVRSAIDKADKAGDADTADLFTEVSRGVDKMLWMVEAHLHAES